MGFSRAAASSPTSVTASAKTATSFSILSSCAFASASGNTLTIHGQRINIDGRARAHDLLPTGIAGEGAFLPRATVNQLTNIPASGYSFQPGSGIVADLRYGIARDGNVILDPEFGAFASASGNTLTIHGQRINIDGRALSHDLLPTGIAGEGAFLPRATVNQLTIIPASGYSFQPGSGIVADLRYGIGRDGNVILDPEFVAFASASGNTLTIHGQRINIDGRALSHDLLPTGIAGEGAFLPRATVNQLTIIPASGYPFQPGSGIVADLRYGIGRDGNVILDPEFGAFASASGNTLTIHGQRINIDGRALSHDLLPTGIAGEGAFLPRATVNQLTIIPASGYSFQPGSGIVADLRYGIGRDGNVILDPEFVAFASASGNTLTIHGQRINIDGRALSHDLLPTGIAGEGAFLPRATVNQLTIIPASGYSFQPGSGIIADLRYAVRADGSVDFPDSCEGFLGGKGTTTLVIRGYPIVLSASDADSDLVALANVGVQSQSPRSLSATLVPAKGYLPQTVNGVFRTGFNVERDGSITFDPAASGAYVVRNSFSPNPSKVGEEVIINIQVLRVQPGLERPQGSVTFSVGSTLLGTATLTVDGEANFRTSNLPRGEHDVVIEYTGHQDFEPSSTKVRHSVE